MIGSPLNLEVLLHCYYSTEEHPRCHAPAFRECISYLADNGMIEWRDGIRRTTEKAEAFINHLIRVPFPVAKWVIPDAPTEKTPS